MLNFKIKKIVIISLCFVILFSLVSCTKVDRSKFDKEYYFTDLYYSKPDYDLYLELFDYILDNRDDFKAAISVNEKYCEMLKLYDDIVLYDNYLTIREALNFKDSYILDQHYYIRKIKDDAYNKILLISKYIRERKCGWFYKLVNGKDSSAYMFPDCTGVYIDDYGDGDTISQRIAINLYYIDSELYEDSTISGDNYEYDYLVPPGMKIFNDDGVWVVTESEIENLYKLGFVSESVYIKMLFDLYSEKKTGFADNFKTLVSTYREKAYDSSFTKFEEYINSVNGETHTASEVIEVGESEKDYLIGLRDSLLENVNESDVSSINQVISESFGNGINSSFNDIFSRIDSSLNTKLEHLKSNSSYNIEYGENLKSTNFISLLYGFNELYMFVNPGDNPDITDLVDFLYTLGIYNFVSNSADKESAIKDRTSMVNAGNRLIFDFVDYLGLVFTESSLANTAKNLVISYLIDRTLLSFANTEFEYSIYSNKKFDYSSISNTYYDLLIKYGQNGKIINDNSCLDFMMNEDLYKNPFAGFELSLETLNSIKENITKD